MSLTQQQADWLDCYKAYVDHMHIECVSRGYDFKAGRIAEDAYMAKCKEDQQKHGERFWPNQQQAAELYAARRAA